MKIVNSLLLTRDDLQPDYQDANFLDINPWNFQEDITSQFSRYELIIFVNSSANQVTKDGRTRIIKNAFGLWGVVSTLNKMRKNDRVHRGSSVPESV
jgi:hypothetical protein